jgi:ATP adenylyltransferase
LDGKRLWAPWRLQYLRGEKSSDCIFCSKPALGDDEQALIVARGTGCYVMLNAFPYTSGHLMVAPFAHVGDLRRLDPETTTELMELTKRSLDAVGRVYGPEGFNVGMNLGEVAGAGFAEHLHMHVVPRWKGDTNFMPAVGDTRVIPEALPDSWRKLRAAFDEASV